MSKIVNFFEGTGADHAGRTLQDILAWDDRELESCHDYIQWLFPNRDPSRFNPHAPLLTDDDVHEFMRRADLRLALGAAHTRMAKFYRLVDPRPWWVTPGNHNFLRLTRILRALRELSLPTEASWLLRQLISVRGRTGQVIPNQTVAFWIKALE